MKLNYYYILLNKKLAFLVLLCSILLITNSCLKEDKPVEKPNINANSIQTAFSTYNTQGYYSLKEAKFIKTNLKTEWDLRFDCDEHFNIWLNSAKFMLVADAGIKNFNEVTDTNGYHFEFDFPSGRRDSNAIDEWGDFSMSNPLSYNHLYILDKGRDELGNQLGFIKMKIKDFASNTYTIEFLDLASTSSTPKTISIAKNSEYNYQYLSLENNGTIKDIEPKKTDWDIWFTQYSTWIYDPSQGFDISYLVIGILNNPYNTTCSFDTMDRFSQIDILEAQSKTYYSNWDIIGYGWKNAGDVSGGGPVTYVTYPQITYIIKTSKTEYYKLHFLDFYNQGGLRGYPKWEQLQL